MAETIKVPGIKEPLPKWGVFAGVGAVGVLIVVYYRNRQNKTGAASTAAADTTGLASGGLLAGDTSSSYPWDGTYGNPSDPYSMDTSAGQTYGNLGYYGGFGVTGSPPTGTPGPPFSSNAGWSAYALQQLTQTASFDANSVAEALGLYLNGQLLDKNQRDIVYAALGVAGPVPVRAADGYPPRLRTSSGHRGGTQFAHNPVSGLKAVARKSELEISWDKSDHATGYQVSLANVTGHRTAHAPVTTTHTSYIFRGLKPDTYRASVLAKPAEHGAKPAEAEAKIGGEGTRVRVPQLKGRTFEQARAILASDQLKAVLAQPSDWRLGSKVEAEQPKAGTEVARGSDVTLFTRGYHVGGK